jgi:cobalt-precorrin-7 (C5)-methyltransferase
MKIVGVGCGPGLLTEEAILAIKTATLIIGSERALDLARRYIPDKSEVRVIDDYKALKNLPDHAVLLSTGDPMVSGLGYLGGEIISGISSIQYGAAKTGIPLNGMYICSAHGRDHDVVIMECCELLRKIKKIAIITDPSFSIKMFGEKLSQQEPVSYITLCENLGYPDERIVKGTCEKPPIPSGGTYILFVSVPEGSK